MTQIYYHAEKTNEYDLRTDAIYEAGYKAGYSNAAYKNTSIMQSDKAFYRIGYKAGQADAANSQPSLYEDNLEETTKAQIIASVATVGYTAIVTVKLGYMVTTYSVLVQNKVIAKGQLDDILAKVKSWVWSERLHQEDKASKARFN